MTACIYLDEASIIEEKEKDNTVIVTGFSTLQLQETLKNLKNAGVRTVLTNIDADHLDARYSCVTYSRRLATEQMMDYLRLKGVKDFAMIGCGIGSENDNVHVNAMADYLVRHGLPSGETFFYKGAVQESFDAFLPKCKDFDAVLCVNPYVAVSFLRYCELKGLRIPDDFLLASLKDSHICHLCCPSITSLSENYSRIGEQAIVVWNYLKTYPSEDLRMRISVMGNIIERESTINGVDSDISAAIKHDNRMEIEGGPFYTDKTIQVLLTIDRYISQCDELDFKIIALMLEGNSNEKIAEKLYLSTSALYYRTAKYYQMTKVSGRNEFINLFRDHFTQKNHFI